MKREDLLKNHRYKWILLWGEMDFKLLESFENALIKAEENKLKEGQYIIQQILTAEEDTAVYHSRAYFV